MKVLMVTSSYEPIVGGTETVIKNLAIQLNKTGIKTDILTINMNELWKPNRIWQIDKVNGLTVYRVPAFNPFGLFNNKIPNILGILFKLYVIPTSRLNKIMEQYDILHFHGEIDMSLFISSFFIKKPKIFHYHSIQIYKKHDIGTYIFRLNKLYVHILNNKVALHVCNSKPGADTLAEVGINKENIVILPNSVDLERFSFDYPCVDLEKHTRRILCLGRLISGKIGTIVNVINAMPMIILKVPNTQLVIVGGGPQYDYIKTLSENMNEQLHSNVITMTGRIPTADVNRLLNLSDVVIGVGQVPIEAMACSKPAIVAGHSKGTSGGNFGGIVSKDNVNELMEYNFSGRNSSIETTPDLIAKSVLKLFCDENYARSIGKFGRKFVENELSVSKIVDKLCLIYDDLNVNNYDQTEVF